jgi:hypothetical protein
MAIIQSKYARGIIPIAYPSVAGAAVAIRFSHHITAALTAATIIELGVIPAGTRVVDIIFDSDGLDAGAAATLAFDVGIMSGATGDDDQARTCGDEFFAASEVGRTGGVERTSIVSAFRTSTSGADRSIGVKCVDGAETFVAGEIGITVLLSTE